MKFCANCGAMIEESVKFCPDCGAAVDQPTEQSAYQQPIEQPAYQQPIEQPAYQQPTEQPVYRQSVVEDKYKGFKMKWYKFLVYFLLWFGAFINIVNGSLTITGKQYDISAGQEGLADTVYQIFPAMRIGDIVCGILILCIVLLGILAAVNLLQLKAIGPKLVTAVYGGGLITTLINIVFSLTLTKGMLSLGDVLTPAVIGSIAGATLMLVLNRVYFKKRESVFVN